MDSRENPSNGYSSNHTICTIEDNDFSSQAQLFKKKVHEAIDVRVENLTYRVAINNATGWQHWLTAHSLLPTSCIDQKINVLNDVSFRVNSGQMLAILGSSGSGKTSLLDVIACRNKTGEVTNGQVLLNGIPRTPAMLGACAAYVRQDDRLMASLTVRETLMFVAQLKLPRSFSSEETNARVDSVIAELGLADAADTRIGSEEIRGISGGERRRVSIGIQMLVDPSLLFLDEPTSGLDSFTASHLVSTLSDLARNQRTIIMSIHQPRSNIFEQFDLVMILSGGHTVYFGEAKHMVDYFTKLGFPCPEFTNPCDFYVDLTTVDPTSEETEETTQKMVEMLQRLFYQNNPAPQIASEVNAVNSKTPAIYAITPPDIYPGHFRQFSVLFRRWMRSTAEDYSLLAIRSLQALFMSLMLGVVYWDLQLDQQSIRDHFGVMYMISVMYPYLIIVDIVETCHKERKLLYFELQDRLYSIEAYYFAKIASDLPLHFYLLILYIIPVYFMASMPLDPVIFCQTYAIVFLSVYCSRAMAMMCASIMPTFQASVFFANTLFSLFVMSSGFFINLENILTAFKWVSVISYLRWGFQGLCMTDIGPLNFTCDGALIPQTCVRDGETALKMYALNDGTEWQVLVGLFSSVFVFLILMFVALKLVPQQPEEHS